MKRRPRKYFTEAEMAEVWDRWQKGESLNAIARGLDRYHSAVQSALARTGHQQTLLRGTGRKDLLDDESIYFICVTSTNHPTLQVKALRLPTEGCAISKPQ